MIAIALIEIQNLFKSFGLNQALVDINIEVEKGEFLAIFGPNGAGKTTLIKIISTLMSPTSGTILINGRDLKKAAVEVRRQIGVISHDTYLYENLTGYENLIFYGRMYGVVELKQRIEKLLAQVGLRARASDRVALYSRGMKQRLSIARAMLHNPEILLLDEPYTGLDQRACKAFEQILRERYSEQRKTVIITSHDLERGLQLCDRAIALNRGRIAFQASKENFDRFKANYEILIGG